MLQSLLKPLFIKWLRERALYVPESRREEIAKRLRIKRETVDAVLEDAVEFILKQVERAF